MRTIKFRGKSLSTGEWVYGYYFVDVQETDDRMCYETLHLIQTPYGDHYQAIEVDPKTVGQYTNYDDMNGKEIYDSDIIQIKMRKKYGHQQEGTAIYGKVEYGEIYIKDNTLYQFSTFHIKNTSIPYVIKMEGEIIGNSHDTPELLTSPSND